MSYLLFRLPEPDTDQGDAVCLGSFSTFDAALAVRDDDAIALLAGADGGPRTARHHIVGDGSQQDPRRWSIEVPAQSRRGNSV
jgi:hypothetical protein